MRNKNLIFSTVLLGCITASTIGLTACSDAAVSGAVKCIPLEKQELIESVSITGKIDGKHIDIENTQKTKAVKVNVREGDFVNKGDILFEFDSAELKEQYDKLSSQYEKEDDKIKHEQSVNEDNLNSKKQEKQAMLNQAQRKINEATAARDDAYKSRDTLQNKYDTLFSERNSLIEQMNNSDSSEEYEELERRTEEASVKLAQYEAELEQIISSLPALDAQVNDAKDAYSNTERQYDEIISNAQNAIDTEKFVTNSVEKDELKEIKKQMESCVVTAPVSGVIVSPLVTEGAVPMSEILVTIVDNSDLFVNANVSEYDIATINDEMSVIVKTAATGTDEIKGSINRISHMSVNSESGVSYPVEIDIDETSVKNELYLGMTARTDIIINKTDSVFAVPYDAFPTTIIDESDLHILVAEPDGESYVARKVPVKLGEESSTYSFFVEVISDELEEGMLIISDPTGIEEGQKISKVIE